MHLRLTSLLLLCALAVSACPVHAQDSREQACARIDAIAQELTARADDREGMRVEFRDSYGQSQVAKRDERDSRLSQQRQVATGRRDNQAQRLRSLATTDVQKDAIETYLTNLQQAITTRRTAVDAAIVGFRVGMDQAIAEHKNAVDTAAATYTSAVDTAIAKAKSDCAAGVQLVSVRQDLSNTIESARAQLRTDRAAISKIRDQQRQLAATRRQVIQQAIDTFTQTMSAERAALRAAFGEVSE